MVPACLMWLIWREQNTRTFEDVEKSVDLLKSLLVGTLFGWSRIWGFTQFISLSDFLHSISVSLSFFCICFKYSLFITVNMMYFFINENIYYLSKKKESGSWFLLTDNPKAIIRGWCHKWWENVKQYMDNLLCVFCCCGVERGEAGIDFKEISSLRKSRIFN